MSAKQESIGGAWKKTVKTKNGDVEILSVSIGEKRFSFWPNSFKKPGEKTPDYKVYEDNYVPKTEQPKSFAGDLPF